MRNWLLHYYSSSTFNTCSHQALPKMAGLHVEIHLKNDVTPVARHKTISVAIHWQGQVHSNLLHAELLGVIEGVQFGEAVEWCHDMVVTRKHNGSPRQTVDLSLLSKYWKRETHDAKSPFHLARRIPRNTWKTVIGTWNGYHNILL